VTDERHESTPRPGFPEDPEPGAGDRSKDRDPHHALNNPVRDPDPTEWPDPYDKREDPRGGGQPPTGSTSTSEPHPSQDPEAEPVEAPEADRLDR